MNTRIRYTHHTYICQSSLPYDKIITKKTIWNSYIKTNNFVRQIKIKSFKKCPLINLVLKSSRYHIFPSMRQWGSSVPFQWCFMRCLMRASSIEWPSNSAKTSQRLQSSSNSSLVTSWIFYCSFNVLNCRVIDKLNYWNSLCITAGFLYHISLLIVNFVSNDHTNHASYQNLCY